MSINVYYQPGSDPYAVCENVFEAAELLRLLQFVCDSQKLDSALRERKEILRSRREVKQPPSPVSVEVENKEPEPAETIKPDEAELSPKEESPVDRWIDKIHGVQANA